MRICIEVLPLDPRSGDTKKFLLLEPPPSTIQQLFPKIEVKYLQGYVDSSWHSTFAIRTIQDTIGNDLDISYSLGDIFEGQPEPHILRVIQTRIDREQSIQVTSTFRPPDARPLPSKRFLPPVPLWNETSNKRRRLDDDGPQAYADLNSDRPIPSCERDAVDEAGQIRHNDHEADHEADADEEDVEVEVGGRGVEHHELLGRRGVETRIASQERSRKNSPAVFRKPDLPALRAKTPAFLRNPYSVDRQASQSRRFGDRSRVRQDVFLIPDSENEVAPPRRRIGIGQPQATNIASRRVSDSTQDLADPLITPDSTRMQAQLALAHAQTTAAQVAAASTANVDHRPTYVQGRRAEPLITHETEDDAQDGADEPFPTFGAEEQAVEDLQEQASSSSDEAEDEEIGSPPDGTRGRQPLRTPFTSFSRPSREPQTNHAASSIQAAVTKNTHPATEDAHERLQSATQQPTQLPQVLDSQPKALAIPKWIPQPHSQVATNVPPTSKARDLRSEHDERQLAAKKAKDAEAERSRRAKASAEALVADRITRVDLRTDDWVVNKPQRLAADVFDFVDEMSPPSKSRRKSAPRATTQAPEAVKSPPKTVGRAKSVAPNQATTNSYKGWDNPEVVKSPPKTVGKAKSVASKQVARSSHKPRDEPEASSSQIQPPGTLKRKSEPSEDQSSKKQARIDFKRKGRAIPQHMLEQDPITVSDTESVLILGRTTMANPTKEPVMVINSPVNSSARQSTQVSSSKVSNTKPRKTPKVSGTKPPNINPRCLPCRGTHKPCEPDPDDLDGPCKRCARLGYSCKLVDGTTRARGPTTQSAEGLSSRRKSTSKAPASSFPFPSSQPVAASPTPAPRGKGPAAARNAHHSTIVMQARSPSYEEGSPMTNDQLIGAYNKALSASQASLSATQKSSQASTSKAPESSNATATAPLRSRLVPGPSKQPARMTTIPGRDQPSRMPSVVATPTISLQRSQSSQHNATPTGTQTSAFATQPDVAAPPVASLRRSQSSQSRATPASAQTTAFATLPDAVSSAMASLQRDPSSRHKDKPTDTRSHAPTTQPTSMAPPVASHQENESLQPEAAIATQTSAFATQPMPQSPSSLLTSKSAAQGSSPENQPSSNPQAASEAASSNSASLRSGSDSRPSPDSHSASQLSSTSEHASQRNDRESNSSAGISPASQARSSVDSTAQMGVSVGQPASQEHSSVRSASSKSVSSSQAGTKPQSVSQEHASTKAVSPERKTMGQPTPIVQSASQASQAQPTLKRSSISQPARGPQSVSQANGQSLTQKHRDSQVHNTQPQMDGAAYTSDSSSSSGSISEGENNFITDIQQIQIDDAPEAKKGSLRKDFLGKLWTGFTRAVTLGAGGSQQDWYKVPDEET